MSKENKSLLVGALSVFLIAVLFVLGYHFVDRAPRSALDHALGQKVSVSNTVVLNKEEDLGELTNGEVYLLSTYDALTKTASLKGVQTVSKNSFGTIKLDVLIDVENRKVFVAPTNIEQTPHNDIDYTKIITEHIKTDYQNISVDDLDTLDLSAGQTAGKGSLGRATIKNSVIKALEKVGIEIQKPEPPRYALWGFESYTTINMPNVTGDNIIAHHVIVVDGVETAYAIEASKEGEYDDSNGYGNINKKPITVIVFLDLSGHIIEVGLPKDEYKHSNYDPYFQNALDFAALYKDQNIKNLIDHNAGSTDTLGSKGLIKQLINEIATAVQGFQFEESKPYSDLGWFLGDYEVTVDSSQTLEGSLEKVEIVKVNEDVVGYVYTLTKNGKYDDSDGHGNVNDKPITVVIGVDADGVILGVDLPKDKYMHSTYDPYFQNALDFAALYKDQNIKNLIDHNAGSTNTLGSKGLIKALIEETSSYLAAFVFPGKPQPYQKLNWFEAGYKVENDLASELLDDKLIKVEIVKKDDLVIGYVYTVKGEGEYDVSGGQGYTSSEFITVVIATDADGLILGIDLPVNEYKHSHGEYLESSQIFVLSYKDKDIKDLLDMDAGQTTPNQGSRVLIKQLINYVSTKVKGAA